MVKYVKAYYDRHMTLPLTLVKLRSGLRFSFLKVFLM